MKTLVDQLTQYAEYHRDRRNIATHFVGIPMIVVAIEGLLARPTLVTLGGGGVVGAGSAITPAAIASTLAVLFYVALDLRFGAAMAALLALALGAGSALAALSTSAWLASSIGLFVVGWLFQFVGHAYEGRKPAFVDDVVGLLVGPLFVTAEVAFAIGLRADLHAEIVRRAGPTRVGRAAANA